MELLRWGVRVEAVRLVYVGSRQNCVFHTDLVYLHKLYQQIIEPSLNI